MRCITRSATVPWWPHKPKENIMFAELFALAPQVANIMVESIMTATNIMVEL